MNQSFSLQSGMNVICVDDESIEKYVKRQIIYQVTEVSHRGLLIKLKGIPISLASSRFQSVKSNSSNPMELIRESM